MFIFWLDNLLFISLVCKERAQNEFCSFPRCQKSVLKLFFSNSIHGLKCRKPMSNRNDCCIDAAAWPIQGLIKNFRQEIESTFRGRIHNPVRPVSGHSTLLLLFSIGSIFTSSAFWPG